jgi:hypothetical protein
MSNIQSHWDRGSHFIGSESCHFGITDVVGDFIISTTGDYRPMSPIEGYDGRQHEIGYGRFYETMVFRDSGERCEDASCKCGGIPMARSFRELDFDGYKTQDEARRGHAAMVARYKAGYVPQE